MDADGSQKKARGAPVGRRVILGMLGLGAAGVASGAYLQDGLDSVLAGVAGKDPTGLTGLVPGGQGFRFLLVGGRAGIYLDLLVEEIKRMKIPNIDIIMETRDAYHYFCLSDMFVCSSFEESFPRVVLEAMAFRTPIVTTDVHGIPEMVTQRQEAYLVPPGDHLALSKMMKT